MAHTISATVPLSIRIPVKMLKQLEDLSNATERTKSFLAAEAIEHYLTIQAWQIAAIKDAVAKANDKHAKFYSYDEITTWLNSWGSENEQQLIK